MNEPLNSKPAAEAVLEAEASGDPVALMAALLAYEEVLASVVPAEAIAAEMAYHAGVRLALAEPSLPEPVMIDLSNWRKAA